MRVFLTGGTGLIGSHVAERLRGRGDEVVALHRPDSDVRFLTGVGCTLVAGDVRDTHDALASQMKGCDGVVHGAALVYARTSWPRVRAINVDGTTHVLRAASLAGISSIVHVSSVAVYGGARGPIDESTPIDSPLPASDLYARSKREAEMAACREAQEAGLALTVLRPAASYGERDRLLTTRVAALVSRRIVPVIGHGRNTLPIVYAGNVAAAVERCLDRSSKGPPRTYDIGFDQPLGQEDFLLGMARALGSRPRLVHLPAALVHLGAELGERLGVTIPGAGDLSLSRFAKLALGENPYGSRRIRTEMGWTPAFGHDEALGRTIAWLRSERKRERAG